MQVSIGKGEIGKESTIRCGPKVPWQTLGTKHWHAGKFLVELAGIHEARQGWFPRCGDTILGVAEECVKIDRSEKVLGLDISRVERSATETALGVLGEETDQQRLGDTRNTTGVVEFAALDLFE